MKPPISNNYSFLENELFLNPIKYEKTVTIVIPFYKDEEILQKSLASLVNQTYPNNLYEVIIVEDGSPITTEYTVNLFKPQISISRLRQERLGFRLSTARNLGITNAQGEVILLLDFDIICSRNLIESHLKWFHIYEKLATFGIRKFTDVSGFPLQEIEGNTEKVFDKSCEIPSLSNHFKIKDKRLPELEYIKDHPFPCNCFYGCNIAFRKNEVLEIGLFDEEFNGNPGYEDYEFGHRLWLNGCYIIYEPSALVLHQENSVVSQQERAKGYEINRKKLYRKIPGLEDFRKSIGKQ